ncbi:MAG: 16S rRNA (guanine(527)-N(7))-methyltransferase RsmG [Bacilli bacterium]
MNINNFKASLIDIGIEITDEQIDKFESYFNFLVVENEKYNLTAITDEKEVYYKHFYDSLAISKFIDFDKQSLCDVGSGAGFPSIPLKIIFNNLSITIIDSLGKRIKFLKALCEMLELDGVECIHARAEDYAKTARERFDFTTARAVASLPMLCELCIPLVKTGGYFFTPKGSRGLEEKDQAKNAVKTLGCLEKDNYSYFLPEKFGERTLLIFKKIKATPSKYPRTFGKIKNRPL